MKKILFLSMIVTGLLLASCSSSSSFESDVKQMAGYRCQLKQLMGKEQDDKTADQIEKLKKEMDDFSNKMEEKYKDQKENKEMDEKADKIMDAEMAKCK